MVGWRGSRTGTRSRTDKSESLTEHSKGEHQCRTLTPPHRAPLELCNIHTSNPRASVVVPGRGSRRGSRRGPRRGLGCGHRRSRPLSRGYLNSGQRGLASARLSLLAAFAWARGGACRSAAVPQCRGADGTAGRMNLPTSRTAACSWATLAWCGTAGTARAPARRSQPDCG